MKMSRLPFCKLALVLLILAGMPGAMCAWSAAPNAAGTRHLPPALLWPDRLLARRRVHASSAAFGRSASAMLFQSLATTPGITFKTVLRSIWP